MFFASSGPGKFPIIKPQQQNRVCINHKNSKMNDKFSDILVSVRSLSSATGTMNTPTSARKTFLSRGLSPK